MCVTIHKIKKIDFMNLGNPRLAKRRFEDEKKFKDPIKYCRQEAPWVPQQNGDEVRAQASGTPTDEGKKKALSLIPANLALGLIAAYQKYLRPGLAASCCFEPGCSEYTKQAILKYGLIKGVFKGLIRILHCHPFSGKSGYDPLI